MGKAKVSSGKDLTTGPIGRGILAFAIPLFLGQLLQQLYNVADAWVVGNFANNNAFAAVSSTGSMTFLIIGFFNGVATGGGVVISSTMERIIMKRLKKRFTRISFSELLLLYLQLWSGF